MIYDPGLLERTLYSALTLYMLAILLRWCAPWLEVEFQTRALRWIPRLTDPLVERIHRLLERGANLPNARDLAPLAAVLAVWVVRLVVTGQ